MKLINRCGRKKKCYGGGCNNEHSTERKAQVL